ncbi:Ig-like domain-containing protein, partial [Martelella mediterranea]|uniref:Ig-like domain-containing protein n=1 Tax=Martelella mediterranea TaxID=293089 RepID=UPI0003719743
EAFDRTAPTVGVEITDNGQDGTLVLTFSPDTDRDSFDPAADLELENADLGTDGTWSTDGDGNQVWTATITPTGNGEVTATVTDGSYTDTAGNEGSEGTDTETFDVDGPSVVVDIDIDDNGLGGDVTFTFSEDVDGFDASDISVNNGTLSNLQQVDGHTWTARVTPEKAGGDLTVTVADESYTDKVGNLGSEGTDTQAFERNAPLAYEDDISLQLAGDDFISDENFNIAFVLDFSGSVDNTEAHQMLEAVKAAGQAFFEGTTGDVQIQLVAFSSDASSTVSFSSYAEFAAQVDAWDSQRPYSGQTNYTAAVNETMESYQPIDGYNNRVYFMSDGEPTRQYETDGNGNIEHSLQSATQTAWNDFVANNQIDVQTVGIGQGVTVPRLQDVDEADGDNHVVQVGNFDDLVDELLDVLKEVDVSGNVLNGADGIAGTADDDLLGIDGGRILSIDVDGETYTYDLNGISDSHGDAVGNGSILNVETDQGGRLVFDFETGDWTYTAGPDTGMGEENFRYVLTDDSGDTSEASLKIDVHEENAGATSSAARMAIETDSAEDSGEAAGQGAFHAETLGLASIDEASAEDDDASGDHPAVDDDINVADLVYEDNVESLEAYLPEEKHADSAAANDPQDFSDPGTPNIDLNELEDHAMMVG